MTPEIAAIIAAAATQTANGKEPRKHHLVPRMYLDRWAENDKIRVTHIDEEPRRSYTPNPDKAARETDFYRVDPDFVVGGSPITFETYLSTIEGNAKPVIDELQTKQPHELTEKQVSDLIHFLGHQCTRGRSYREQLRTIVGHGTLLMLGDTDDDLVWALKRAGVKSPTDEQIAGQREFRDRLRKNPSMLSIGQSAEVYNAGQSAQSMTGVFYMRQAVVYPTPPRLVTCDDPVIEVYEDMSRPALGLWGAPFIVFPLSPTRVLVLVRHDIPVMLEPGTELTVRETNELNSLILGNADRLAFERPSGSLSQKLFMPSKPQPVRMENLGAIDSNGSELLKLSRPRRWQGEAQAPVRPVARWWPLRVPRPHFPTPEEQAVLDQFRPAS